MLKKYLVKTHETRVYEAEYTVWAASKEDAEKTIHDDVPEPNSYTPVCVLNVEIQEVDDITPKGE